MAKIEETIFIRDKFEIFIYVINWHFYKLRYDTPVILHDLINYINDTEIIFNEFDNTLSVEENVEKFYKQ